MKKKILIISAIMLAAFSLAGCQSKTEQEPEEQAQQSREDQSNADLLSGKHHAEITELEPTSVAARFNIASTTGSPPVALSEAARSRYGVSLSRIAFAFT